jgi:hypothetical protein
MKRRPFLFTMGDEQELLREFCPALLSGCLCDLTAPLWGELRGSLFSTLGSALTYGDCGGCVLWERLWLDFPYRLQIHGVRELCGISGSFGVSRHAERIPRETARETVPREDYTGRGRLPDGSEPSPRTHRRANSLARALDWA